MLSYVLLLALIIVVVTAEIISEEGVLVLNDANFQEAMDTYNTILVEFYAPWCGHCKSLAPEWAKAAHTLSKSTVKLAKVDATESKGLAESNAIRGFPTIKYFSNGKSADYNGGRTESEIVSWVNKKSGPAASTLSTEDELTNFQEAHDAFVLGVFASSDSDSAKAFLALAQSDDSNSYAISTSEAIRAKLAVSGDSLVVLKSFDEGRSDFPVSGEWNAEEAATFVQGAVTPLIQVFSQESSKKIFSSPVTRHVLFFTDSSADHHSEMVSTFTTVAGGHKGKFLFVNVPSSETRVLDFFGFSAKDMPAMILADMGAESGMKKFPYTGALEASAVSTFLSDFEQNKLQPTLKSEDVAPEDTQSPVVVLKGKSFADLVINNSKDVLIEFYAPWCGHCKKLAPTWDELGETFKNNDNIVIAKMDATANEIDAEGFAVKGFPTLYFAKGNDKAHPVKYEGARELKDLVEFLKTNAHNSVDHDEL